MSHTTQLSFRFVFEIDSGIYFLCQRLAFMVAKKHLESSTARTCFSAGSPSGHLQYTTLGLGNGNPKHTYRYKNVQRSTHSTCWHWFCPPWKHNHTAGPQSRGYTPLSEAQQKHDITRTAATKELHGWKDYQIAHVRVHVNTYWAKCTRNPGLYQPYTYQMCARACARVFSARACVKWSTCVIGCAYVGVHS